MQLCCVHDVHTSELDELRHKIYLSCAQIEARGAEVCTVPRGGQVTYHGPGQLVAYPITNVRRLGCGPRRFVDALEDSVIGTAGAWGLAAQPHRGATAGVRRC
jgi:lipoyl(octanoyl) transferase 2